MSAIEDSLRRALANGNAHDPAYRESIYAASERALERMIAARSLEPAAADEQRGKLIGTIERVEAEYGGSLAEPQPAVPEPGPHPDEAFDEPAPGRSPSTYAPPPATPSAAEPADEWRPATGTQTAARRPRRGLLLVALAVAVLLAIVLYVASAIFQPSETVTSQDDSAAGAPQTATDTQTVAEAPAQAPVETPPPELNWISVFSGGELEALTAPAGGRVEAVEADGRTLVRIAGQSGAPAGAAVPEGETPEVALALGPGLVGELAGSQVRVEIRAGSPDGTLREFAVRCQFGPQSVCDRQRFATMMAEEAFVFDIEIPAGAETPASLAIAPGLGTEGGDIDLYSVRMRVL